MIETSTTKLYANAQKRAHEERGEAFNQMVRALPRLIKSIRTRA